MKIAIVTGASSGMGREAVIQLWQQFAGFDEIWAVARRKDRLEELKHMVGVSIRCLELDLTRREQLFNLAETLSREKPQVKFLVNAAGYGKIGLTEELPFTEECGMAELNCVALTAVTRLVLPYMAVNSRILQFSSSAAFLPQPGFAVYAATKAYVLSYSRALNQELKKKRIFVTAVCPGPVKTEFFDIAETTGQIPLYKRLVMANPKRVVRKALRDSIACRDLSVYGITMKAFHLICKLLPHGLLLSVLDRISSVPLDGRDTFESSSTGSR